MKNPVYRKWTDPDGGAICHAKIYPCGRVLLVSFHYPKIRVADNVRITVADERPVRDRIKLPPCAKGQFEKALATAQRKIAYLARRSAL